MVAAEAVSRVEEPQGSIMWGDSQDTLKVQAFISLDDTVFPFREYRKELIFPPVASHFAFV